MARKIIRYLGLDFGISTSKICYTTVSKEGIYGEPKAVMFKGSVKVPSLILMNEKEEIVAIGTDTYKGEHFLSEGMSVQKDIKLRLIEGDPSAEKSMASLAQIFSDDLK